MKGQRLELERCLFLNSSQGSCRQSKRTCCSTHTTAKRQWQSHLQQGSAWPNPVRLEAVLGQREASHL
jgi:hypothetical protein